jgi:hypothetical protein
LFPSSISAQDKGNQGGRAGRPPLKEEEVKASREEITAFLKKVDAKRYSLEAHGKKDFSCTVPLAVSRPNFGKNAEALLFWKAPDKAAVKFAGIHKKNLFAAKLGLEHYFKELILFSVGVPLRISLAHFDMNLKKTGDWHILTGKAKDPGTGVEEGLEMKFDKDLLLKNEMRSATRKGRTTKIFRSYSYKTIGGNKLPVKIRITGADQRITTVDIDYQFTDGVWIRSRSMNTPMAMEALNLKKDLWEYRNPRFNTGLDDSLFEKGK